MGSFRKIRRPSVETTGISPTYHCSRSMRLVICAALVCSCVLAQDQGHPKNAPPPGTLHSITVKGNHIYAADDIVKESGLKIGQHVTGAVIEQARKKLESTELFTSVADEYRFGAGLPPAYDLTFQVDENQQIFPMRFERLGVSADKLRDYLRNHVDLYADRIPGTEGVLHRYTSAIEEFVHETNPSLKVKALISNDDPQQLAVVFSSDIPAADDFPGPGQRQ